MINETQFEGELQLIKQNDIREDLGLLPLPKVMWIYWKEPKHKFCILKKQLLNSGILKKWY